MKVSKEQMARNRERILDTAAELFRERGFDGVGVASLMDRAGLTHGGFYGHFASKEDLMAQAASRAATQAAGFWADAREAGAETPTQLRTAFANRYLSQKHLAAPGQGCVLAALGGDASRQGTEVRRVMGDSVRATVERLAEVNPGRDTPAKRSRALADYATMVGAVVMARAVGDASLSEEILLAAREQMGLPAGEKSTL